MKMTRNQLELLIEKYLLTEAVHDKVAAQLGISDPDKIEQLRIASENPHKLQKPELVWIGKYFTTPEGMSTKEPIVDIVKSIKSLKQNKAALTRRGSATNLTEYESPGQINIAVSLSKGFVDISQLSEQADVLYEDDNWTLYMPHSREASCTIGRGTSWCTAIPGSGNNLFYHYVISGRAILYYLVKKKPTENESPATTHFSLGTMDGKIPFPVEGKGSGHIVVDGLNKGLTKKKFLSQVGSQLGGQIISVIEKHSQDNRNNHPAKQKIFEMLKNPALYAVEMRGKSIDIRYDFTAMMTTKYKDIINFGSKHEFISDNDIQLIVDVFVNPNDILHKMIAASTEIKQKDVDILNKALETGDGKTVQKYGKIFGDGSAINEAEDDARRSTLNTTNVDDSKYSFCRGIGALTGAIPSHLYQKTESMATNFVNLWTDEEMSEASEGNLALQDDGFVSSELSYTLENDDVTEGFDGQDLDSFIAMLRLYQTNILLESGYSLIHDSQYWASQPDNFAGTLVTQLDDYMSTDPEEMYWISDKHPNYMYTGAFPASEIRQYMTEWFDGDFVQWCDIFGFNFTV